MQDVCAVYGAGIAAVVGAAKRVPLVARYPKVTAALVAVAGAALPYVGRDLAGLDAATVGAVLRCAAEQFAAAVVVHEVVSKPVGRRARPAADKVRARVHEAVTGERAAAAAAQLAAERAADRATLLARLTGPHGTPAVGPVGG